MRVLVCPDGHNIDGTLERLSGVAQISGHVTRDQHGRLAFEHGGYTEIDWDSQATATNADGETLFVCDNGDAYPGAALVPVPGRFAVRVP